jgi:hypothetical protein
LLGFGLYCVRDFGKIVQQQIKEHVCVVLPQLEQLVRVVIGVGHFSRYELHELEETLLGQPALKHGVEARKGKLPVLYLIRRHHVHHVVYLIAKLIKLDILVCVVHVGPKTLENRIR